MKSIKTKLILTFAAVILVLTGSLGLISIRVVRSNLNQSSHNQLMEIAREEAKYISARVRGRLDYVGALAQNPMLTDESVSFEEKVRFFEGEAARTGYLAFAFADRNGDSTVFNTARETTNVAGRDYFQSAISGEAAVSDVLISSVTGKAVLIFAVPVHKNGQIIGVLYGRRDGNALSEIVSELTFGKTGFAYIINTEGTSVGDRDRELVTSQANFIEMAETDPDLSDLAELMKSKMFTGTVGSGEYAYQGKDQIVAFAPRAGSPWIAVVGMETSEVTEGADALRNVILIVCLTALALGLAVVYFISARISGPIKTVTVAAKEIAGGNFDVKRFASSNDEVGQLSRAFNLTIDRLINYQGYIDEIADALLEISRGNLTVEPKREYVGQFQKLKDNMNALLRGLNATLSQVNQAADQVASGSEQMADGGQALSQGASEQASAVEELSASLTEVSAQIQQNAESARLVSVKSESAGRELQNSERQMGEMISAMEEIAAKSAEISKIIKTIDDITFQTNILALNAAIEAARAGTAGKGFSVVADEVRNLAGKSAEAAKVIAALIEETLAAVENGSAIVERTAGALEETAKISGEVVTLVGAIASATEDQALSISQVNQGVEQISMVVQTNAATAEEAAATSQELSGQSALLKDLLSRFKLRAEG